MAKLALLFGITFQTGVEVLARELTVHVQTFVLLGTTIFHIELAKFCFPWWTDFMGIWTV